MTPSTGLSASILQTLIYSSHFGFPLTLDEIHERLVGVKSTRQHLIRQIQLMLKNKTISQTGTFYHLKGQSSLVSRRRSRAKLSQPQLARAHSLAKLLSRFPTVRSIFLTGSLAMANSTLDSDIDFLIITEPHRLWTTRLFLTLYTTLLGLRRTPSSTQFSGKVCLNLYLTPLSYELPNHKQSLYSAYELIQAVPLYDPHNTQADLLSANPWIKKYLPNAISGPAPKRTLLNRNSRLQVEKGPAAAGRRVLNGIMKLIESLAYHLQLLYMRKRLTREYVTPDAAFFHPHNPAPPISKV